jgi:hypothetical protein
MSNPSSKEFSSVETPVPGRMKLRDLMSLARERLGDRAADLKTREELEAALFPSSPQKEAPPSPAVSRVVITRDFFLPTK